VVLTGDVTHSGRVDEYELFEALFRPLRQREMLTVVPGNHDCGGENVAELLSDELRVSVDTRDGLFLVCINSTAPHNVRSWRAHGELCHQTLEAVDQALDLAPMGRLRCVVLHHHVLPLPVEGVGEWFAEQLGWPHAGELALGRDLLRRVRGRCDLVLHGHRHRPRQLIIDGPVSLQVLNAGSTTELGAFRVFSHHGGRLEAVRWLEYEKTRRIAPVRDASLQLES
jgi:3',5'-cyclic-AMP phosphodiesterase